MLEAHKLVRVNALVVLLLMEIDRKFVLDAIRPVEPVSIQIGLNVWHVQTRADSSTQTPENVHLSVSQDILNLRGSNAPHAGLHVKNAQVPQQPARTASKTVTYLSFINKLALILAQVDLLELNKHASHVSLHVQHVLTPLHNVYLVTREVQPSSFLHFNAWAHVQLIQ